MEKISACLIVYNEEKLIRRCLESLYKVVDEIILVHDGECKDKTLEIAKEYGARIYIQPHVGGAEEYRPFSFEQASNNWILQIDADEFLSIDLKNNLSKLVSSQQISAYDVLWPLWDGGKESGATWPYKRCLFRKDKISFLGILQFVVAVSGKIEKTNFKLNHQPEYNNFSYYYFLKKQLPWAKLQASSYFKKFSEIKKFNWQDNEWSNKIIWRKKHPLLLMPLEFFITFFKNIFSGAYRAGWLGIKISMRAGLYRMAVNYYIYKLKK
ncbi:MAG: glycosyltransferase [Patescibacteria group bacterium]